jgi:hypothetical protein
VDSAASAITDIMFQSLPLKLVYHLENPVRQGWPEMVRTLAGSLEIPSDSIIPLGEWLRAVTAHAVEGNPASKLVNFLEIEFMKMSCGTVILDTSNARYASQSLRRLGAVDADAVEGYVRYWRSAGVI